MLPTLVSLFSIILSFSLGQCQEWEPLAPALYVFGDSLVDAGNNNHIGVPKIARADFLPYGWNFKRGFSPSGRVSNGKIVPDFIAEYLELPQYPPAYKEPNRPNSLIGYNYASAGCGILQGTGPAECLRLSQQVSMFETTVDEELKPILSPSELEKHLANSIFFIWIGNNDYLLNYFLTNSSEIYNPEQFSDLLIDQLKQKIERLYNKGARKIVLFEVAALGCIPFYVKGGSSCDATKNDIANLYNNKLRTLAETLSASLKHSYFTVGDAFALSLDAFTNPSKYGLTNVKDSCCKVFPLTVGCYEVYSENPLPINKPCASPDRYLFWDKAHPTEAAYSQIALECISGSLCAPLNIEQLVLARPSSSSILSA